MNARVFTLDEARATLPRVVELMERAQEARRELIGRRADLWPTLRQAAFNGGSREAGDVLVHFQELERSVKGIVALGVVVKDIDTGLVDFLAIRDGREVYLCWRYGEPEIAYWHEIELGFAGRAPLDNMIE